MYLKVLPYDLTVCKTADTAALDLTREFYFIAKPMRSSLSFAKPPTPLPAPLHARTVGAAFA